MHRFRLVHIIFLGCFVCIGIIAFTILYYATEEDLGVSPDSVTYILAAQSLMAGRGFSVNNSPLTHFPPLYPLFLALVGFLFQGDILLGARISQALLFSMNVVLIGAIVYRATRFNLIAALCAALLTLSSKDFLRIHSWAWSEPLFMFLINISLLMFFLHFRNGKNWSLVLGSIFLGLGIVTRYIGIALFPGLWATFLVLYLPHRRGIGKTLISGIIGGSFISTWLIRNLIIAQNATNRTLALHPVQYKDFRNAIHTLSDFFLPIRISGWLFLVVLCLLGLYYGIRLLSLWKKCSSSDSEQFEHAVLSALCLFFIVSYLLFLIISKSFIDAATPFDYRILSPLFVWIVIGTLSLVFCEGNHRTNVLFHWMVVLPIVVLVIFNSRETLNFVSSLHHNGQGYTSVEWKHSPTIQFVQSLDDNRMLVSNGADAIIFLTGKKAQQLPIHANSLTMQPNPSFQFQLSKLCEEVSNGLSIIILFSNINRWYVPNENEIKSVCPELNTLTLADGVIFYAGATFP